jgi:hypothetical protein
VPLFPYRANVEGMSRSPPRWPHPTWDITELEIEIRFKPRRRLSGLLSSKGSVRLNITDYPGEWLLDLPLLRQSYADWSRATLEICGRGVRAAEAADWRNYIALHGGDEPADETVAKHAHDLYRALLIRCREQYGLSYLQPGRFVRMGGLEEAPFLWFCPLEPAANRAKARPGSLRALMETRSVPPWRKPWFSQPSVPRRWWKASSSWRVGFGSFARSRNSMAAGQASLEHFI